MIIAEADAGEAPEPATAAVAAPGAEAATAAAPEPTPAPDAATTEPEPTGQRTPRPGTKQALLIDLLRRPEGATVEQIAAATGWQHHTVRGAISGALKKKLGLTLAATRTREVGPTRPGAKGSGTVYRIPGSSPRTA